MACHDVTREIIGKNQVILAVFNESVETSVRFQQTDCLAGSSVS